jgi:hypothetical protein
VSAAGLRLDQAPPFSVPMRFFLTAPLFALLATAVLAWHGPAALASRWTPALLAVTHLFTLGFLAMVMLGALLQLLPVLAGSPVMRPRRVGAVVHVLLILGTLSLSFGFLGAQTMLLRAALVFLGAGFVVFLAAAGASLARANSDNPAVRPMRLALLGLALTAALGIGLGLRLSGSSAGIAAGAWTDVHLGWGLIGWVGLLIIGVACQVVPMFQLTPAYPARLMRGLPGFVFIVLLAWSLSAVFAARNALLAGAAGLLSLLLGLGLAGFALATLWLQHKRRRRLADVTLYFWRLAMLSLLACVIMAMLRAAGFGNGSRIPLLLGAWMIVGFASSAIHGMLYKIVPFLAWLHLHESRDRRQAVPSLKEILPDARTLPHLGIHALALLLMSAALLDPGPRIFYPAAAALALSYAWLGWNLYSARARYRRVVKTARAASDGYA